MRIGISYGDQQLHLDVRQGDLVGLHRLPAPDPIADLPAAVSAALEAPLGFPALRRALTPDDHVTIVVDEHLPRLAEIVTPILQHVTGAGVHPDAITLVCAPPASTQDWIDELPDEFQDVRVEVHDPTERRKLSYLATTGHGRRIYLNRTAVDADQLIVVARRGYDPILGYSGAEGALYPALSDEATRQELAGKISLVPPGERAWPVSKEATEVAWLLGAPFLLQIIEGSGEEVAHVLGGLSDTSVEGQRLLNARWRVEADRAADTVVAAVGTSPGRQTFADWAQALTTAARVVKPGGRIILLAGAKPALDSGAEMLRQSEDPRQALQLLDEKKPSDLAAAFQWAHAAQRARIYLLSGLDAETVEDLFAVPLENPAQVQRLLDGEGTCALLADAEKTLAVVRNRQPLADPMRTI
jgi:nickel-dependent lactate racemase